MLEINIISTTIIDYMCILHTHFHFKLNNRSRVSEIRCRNVINLVKIVKMEGEIYDC